MERRTRPTSTTGIARGLGGRSGFGDPGADDGADVELSGAPTSKAERVAAVRNWHDAINHFEDYEDQNRFRLHRLRPSSELLVAIGIVLVFVGGYAGFIAFLALTR